MPQHDSGSVRTPAVLLTAVALLLVLPGTAGADGSGERPAHPEKDWMGSTIEAHEGRAPEVPETSTQASPRTAAAGVEGVDVSSHNGNVAWSTLRRQGVRFAYVKATEGTSYRSPRFAQQYNGSYRNGMIRGSYHFAVPSASSGAAQANYFVKHGGGWSRDGKTLPGALDIEYNPYGNACYGKSQRGMTNWIRDFVRTYKKRTGRDAVIYTSRTWWRMCTGNTSAFRTSNPLWVPSWGRTVGKLPGGWPQHTIWQYTSKGRTVGDHDRFNGSYARLKVLANGR